MKLTLHFVLALFLCAFPGLTAKAAGVPAAADLLSSGRMDEAVRRLNVRVHSNPKDAEAYHLLSRAYFHLKKWDDAISYGERAVQLNPSNSDYHMWLGRAYGEKAEASSFITAAGLTKKIRQSFERAVELDGRNLDARSDLAEFYVEAPSFMGGGLDKASEQAQQIATLDPAKGHWANARIAEKRKDTVTAEREYQAAIASSPDADYWLNLASFYRRQNRLQDMESAVSKAMASNIKHSNSLYDAATLLYRAGRNLTGAAAYARKYLSLPNQNEDAPAFEAHYLLGAILQKEGDKAGAANEYRAALALAADYKPAEIALKHVND